MVLLPKFLGILPFDQAHKGAEEAAKELQNPTPLQFLGPTPENSVAGQIEIVTNATTQGVNAIMISNNSGDQIVPAAKAAQAKPASRSSPGTRRSPRPRAKTSSSPRSTSPRPARSWPTWPLNILGADGGEFAILSASPDAANQNAWIAAMKKALKDPKYAKLKLVDTVYGNDQSEESYNQALALVDKYPDLKLIMAPTSVGIVAAAKAHAGREAVRQGQGHRPRPAQRDGRLHQERLRAGVRAVELRRPRLPDLLHHLSARHGQL